MDTLKEQKSGNTKIEFFIPVSVAEDKQQDAFALVVWFRANKMAPTWSGVNNAWNANYKGRTICKISLRNGGWSADNPYSWNVGLYLENMNSYEGSILHEGLQDIILSRVYKCKYCIKGTKHCVGGFNITVLGHEYKGICNTYSHPAIYDPNAGMIEKIQKLIGMEQHARTENAKLPPTPPPMIEPIFSPLTDVYKRIENQVRVSGVSGKTKSASKIFDGKYDDDYGSRNGSDVLFQLDKPEKLMMYSIVTGASEDLPVEWTLFGYDNANGQWEQLDKQSRADIPSIMKHTEIAFGITIPGVHQRYKLNMKSKGYVKFAQLHLFT